MKPPSAMYRYDVGSGEVVVLDSFPVLKVTPRGKWISVPWAKKGKRFVLDEGTKRFAWETKEAALESLRRRNVRRCAILRSQLEQAETLRDFLATATPETVSNTPFYLWL